jgi:signal transduction histidine kinase
MRATLLRILSVLAITIPILTSAQTTPTSLSQITNVSQLRTLDSREPNTCYSIRLEGDILWANNSQGRLVLQDSTGAEELELELGKTNLQAGQRVRMELIGTIAQRGGGFQLGVKGPLVDNNGVHSMVEKSGAVYLAAGRHPVRLEWFNGVEKYDLQIELEGAGLPRQRIPNSMLFRRANNNFINGVDYRCFEVAGEILPDFNALNAIKSGFAANFDLSVKTQNEHIGLEFSGFLQVPREGVYTFHTKSDDGSRLFITTSPPRIEMPGPGKFPETRTVAIGQTMRENENGEWAETEGTVTFARMDAHGRLLIELSAGAGHVRLEVGEASNTPSEMFLGHRIRATGFCQSASTADGQKVPGVLLVPDINRIVRIETSRPIQLTTPAITNDNALPLLTTATEVHRLKREEAQRGYPVKLRGVITSVLPEHQAFTLQDATRGIYVVDVSSRGLGPPHIGEYIEVEGSSDPSLFAPIVNARHVHSLGAGHLPPPTRPTWDQLVNGSLDAQYVELQGIITAVHSNGVSLLTSEGTINVELRVTGMNLDALRNHENALVRIRGCLYASWDYVTHQVKVGEVRIYAADVMVDQPAPADLFSIPQKSVVELLQFDPQASVLQRVKVSGQIIHTRDTECFLMDGMHGLRFTLRKPANLSPGDKVEVVGFPEFGRAFPILREAVARHTGRSTMPPARILPAEDLHGPEYDSTLVRVEGTLLDIRKSPDRQVLEMQSGIRTFVARLAGMNQPTLTFPTGSKLELTGVYAIQGGNRAGQREPISFELLLNSPGNIRVLARPPLWTFERLLMMLGALACVLLGALLWIKQLHRQVEQRTTELKTEIQERQRVEHQREMEQERARVAQDLHDELGSGLTEISMLAARSQRSDTTQNPARNKHLEQVSDKAHEMVTALDEIVWAMNPTHDSFASLVSYFCLYADRFLGLAGIAWKLDDSSGNPGHVVDSRRRHQLFLAFKEALTNVVRHSQATEVRLGIRLDNGRVHLSVTDNGRGLATGTRTEEMDGVANMRSRIEKMNGTFEISSKPGHGTVLRFQVPAS